MRKTTICSYYFKSFLTDIYNLQDFIPHRLCHQMGYVFDNNY
ncbi:MAG: hypothetical protein QF757_02990 [Candidatus Marinimicrobia bacterium]|nr:hypothetical protein [Candidatus Neomarinimicrobiota bacterium]